MRLQHYMAPIGFVPGLFVLVLTLVELLILLFGDVIIEMTPGIFFLFVLYSAYWVRKTQILMENELNEWCKEKAPDIYKKYHGGLSQLKKVRAIYITKLRKSFFVPSLEIRRSIFEQILQVEMNTLPKKKTVAFNPQNLHSQMHIPEE